MVYQTIMRDLVQEGSKFGTRLVTLAAADNIAPYILKQLLSHPLVFAQAEQITVQPALVAVIQDIKSPCIAVTIEHHQFFVGYLIAHG